MAYAVQALTHYQTYPEGPPGADFPPKKVCNLDPMAPRPPSKRQLPEAPVNPSPTARHITGGSQQGAYFPSGLDEQPSVGPPPTRIVGASEWPAAAALSGFSAGAGVCQAFPPPLPNESKAT